MKYFHAMEQIRNHFPFEKYIRENKFGDIYQTVFSITKKYLPKKSKVLDFGSGPCDKTALISLLGHHCVAYDDLQDAWHKEHDNRKNILNFSEKFGIEYVDASKHNMDFKGMTFDMIVMTDVIEHLHESPKNILLKLLSSLNDDGVLFITVPNAGNIRKRVDLLRGRTNLPPFSSYYWYPGLWRGHIREYVYKDLTELAVFLDLEIILLRGSDHMLSKVPAGFLPLYKLVTAIFPRWKDSWTLIAKKNKNWSPMLEENSTD